MKFPKGKLWVLPLAFVLLISGCSSLPFLPTTGTSLENDVVIIRSLEAIPSLAKASQQVRLIAYIENRGTKPFKGSQTISVDLFDYCTGLFKEPSVKCPEADSTKGTSCSGMELLPKETKEIDWLLDASDIKLKSSCELKVSVEYPYTTNGLTSISFINSNELQTQLERGTFITKASSVSKGDGPVKAFFKIDDRQPIPTSSAGKVYTPVSLEVENVGGGIVKDSEVKITSTNIGATSGFDYKLDNCVFKEKDPYEGKLVKNKASLPCSIEALKDSDVGKELTKQLETEIEYNYEFRKSAKVTVEPVVF